MSEEITSLHGMPVGMPECEVTVVDVSLWPEDGSADLVCHSCGVPMGTKCACLPPAEEVAVYRGKGRTLVLGDKAPIHVNKPRGAAAHGVQCALGKNPIKFTLEQSRSKAMKKKMNNKVKALLMAFIIGGMGGLILKQVAETFFKHELVEFVAFKDDADNLCWCEMYVNGRKDKTLTMDTCVDIVSGGLADHTERNMPYCGK